MHSDYPILFVDNERATLAAVDYALGDKLTIDTANSGPEALKRLVEREYAVLMADLRMPHMNGVQLCEKATQIRPHTVRMILTAHGDVESAMEAIERGQVARYLRKPFDNEDLLQALISGIDLHRAQKQAVDLQKRLLEVQPTELRRLARREVMHEVDNLIGALDVNVERLHLELQKLSLRSKNRDIRAAANCIREVVEQLHSLTESVRHDPLVRERCRPAAVLHDVITWLRPLIPAEIELKITTESDPHIAMHYGSLMRVLANLVLNASQAIQQTAEKGIIDLHLLEQEGCVVIYVSDDGPGIKKEIRDRIFDRGFTTRSDGNGLGLPMVCELLAEVGGSIDLENRTSGTCFRIFWRVW